MPSSSDQSINDNVTKREIEASINAPFTGYFDVAPGVWGMKDILVNIYMIQDLQTGDWVLIDAGLKSSAHKIQRMALQLFGDVAPKAIILTHGHFDHVGALTKLLGVWDVPVYAHSLELPYLTGRSSYPPPDPSVGGGLMSLMAFMYPHTPINLGEKVQALPEDFKVPFLQQWIYIHTPGHAPGHISLFREEDRVIIAGDAFVTTRQESVLCVMMQTKVVSRPPAYFTYDWGAAGESVHKLLYCNPEIVATGHGRPMRGKKMIEGLRRLNRHFYSKQIPSQGRYVYEPALVNADGVVKLPPPVKRDKQKWMFAAGLIAGFVVASVLIKANRGQRLLAR